MFGFAEAPEAWMRARRMALTQRLNLAGAVVEGWLDRGEVADLVDHCRSCLHSAPCRDWVESAPSPATLPAFCANKAVIAALAP
jgi:hypothetical protein